MHFSERLFHSIKSKNTPLCVGFDPHLGSIPEETARRYLRRNEIQTAWALAVEEFLLKILDRVAPLVPVIKPQFAFYERLGREGWRVLSRICREARDRGLLVIGDAKRGDIGSTAEAYAEAYLPGIAPENAPPPVMMLDAITLNPFMGHESVKPFLHPQNATGVFVLARTSNPGGEEIQMLQCEAGTVSESVARYIAAWGAGREAGNGYSDIGAVVGAPDSSSALRMRELMPRTIFLIPGYGFQGSTAEDAVITLDKNGMGGIINSSRNILYAYRRDPYRHRFDPDSYDLAAEAACRDAILELGKAVSSREN